MEKRTLTWAILIAGLIMSPAGATTIYSTLPYSLDTTYSLGYEAASVAEFGDLISIAPGHNVKSAAVLLSNWAYESAYESVGTSPGYVVPVTLTLYSVGEQNTVASPIASSTTDVLVPWRAEP